MALNEAFDTLADDEVWEQAGATLAGFLAPTVARNLIEPNTGFDVPDELYGIAVIAGSRFSPMYQNEMAVGGGMYAGDKLLERFGLKQSLTSLGGS